MKTATRYSVTADRTFTQADLEAMNLTELKDLFNAEGKETSRNPEQFKPLAKFSDKVNAVRRVWATMTEEVVAAETTETASEATDNTATCTTCGRTQATSEMDRVSGNWYCKDEATCEVTAGKAANEPNEHNVPEGMVYCGLCKSHVPADTAEPTADPGVYTCKELCIGKKGRSLKDKAKAANATSKAARQPKAPKEKKERKVKYPAHYVVKHIKPRACRGFSAVAYGTIQDGMTVKEVCEAIAALETGAITGLSEINYDVVNGYITCYDPATVADQETTSTTDEA
jgi:hypothetical protein